MKRKGVTIEKRDFAVDDVPLDEAQDVAEEKLEQADIGEEREFLGMQDRLIAVFQCNGELVKIWEAVDDSNGGGRSDRRRRRRRNGR